jgi:hypothetical protein
MGIDHKRSIENLQQKKEQLYSYEQYINQAEQALTKYNILRAKR